MLQGPNESIRDFLQREKLEAEAALAGAHDLILGMFKEMDPSTVFSGGRDADRCHWCRRDMPSYNQGYPAVEEQHDSDCWFLLWRTKAAAWLYPERFKAGEEV